MQCILNLWKSAYLSFCFFRCWGFYKNIAGIFAAKRKFRTDVMACKTRPTCSVRWNTYTTNGSGTACGAGQSDEREHGECGENGEASLSHPRLDNVPERLLSEKPHRDLGSNSSCRGRLRYSGSWEPMFLSLSPRQLVSSVSAAVARSSPVVDSSLSVCGWESSTPSAERLCHFSLWYKLKLIPEIQ